jgi:hypothetical protein
VTWRISCSSRFMLSSEMHDIRRAAQHLSDEGIHDTFVQ